MQGNVKGKKRAAPDKKGFEGFTFAPGCVMIFAHS